MSMSKVAGPRRARSAHTYSIAGKEVPIGDPRCDCGACKHSRGESSSFTVTTLAPRTAEAAAPNAPVGLLTRLIDHFGLGECPEKRNALYARLSLLAERDRRVEILIYEAAQMAEGRDRPDRYFAKAIVLKLRECGVYSWPSK